MSKVGSATARASRIQQAMASRGIAKLCVLAALMGVTESAISRWRQGGPITLENAALLCESLDVSLDWLVLGRGEMEAPVANSKAAVVTPYTRLPSHLRRHLDAFLHALMAGN